MGTGMTYFKGACEAKALPWQQIIQMILALLSGFCPTPPKTKGDLNRVWFKRGRLIRVGMREDGLSWEEAAKLADGTLAILSESTDEQVSAFLSELE